MVRFSHFTDMSCFYEGLSDSDSFAAKVRDTALHYFLIFLYIKHCNAVKRIQIVVRIRYYQLYIYIYII